MPYSNVLSYWQLPILKGLRTTSNPDLQGWSFCDGNFLTLEMIVERTTSDWNVKPRSLTAARRIDIEDR